jgi:hypothetical protein
MVPWPDRSNREQIAAVGLKVLREEYGGAGNLRLPVGDLRCFSSREV